MSMNELKPEDVMPEGAVMEALELREPHDAVCRCALAILREKDAEIKGLVDGWSKDQDQFEKQLVEKDAEIERLKQENKDLHDNTDVIIEMVTIARAEAIDEVKLRLSMHFGTYTDKDMTPIKELFGLIDRIAEEMKGEGATHGE